MKLPYLVTETRLRDFRVAVIAGVVRKLDATADQVPECRHTRQGERDSCASCVERRTWKAAARLARGEAARG